MVGARRGGRQAEAARNDGLILQAARTVFLADPASPISAVARQAGVGISALYLRYPSKEHLLRELAADGLRRFAVDLEQALADRGDAWEAYTACLHRVLTGGSQGLAQRLAGTFTPTEELDELAATTDRLYRRLHSRVRRARALRRDVTPEDVVLLLEMVTVIDLPGTSGDALRHRYLTLLLQSLHVSDAASLPGPAASGADLAARWRPR